MKKLIMIFLIIFLFSPQVFCQEVGKIVSTQGRVDIFKEGCQSAVPAIGDDLISAGDGIRTKSGSKAQVIFRDKSVLKLAQNSKVLIKDYQLDDKERRISAVIELSRGKARAIIAKTPSGAGFVIKTPNAEGTVKGSDITAFYQAGNSGMFVSEGKLSVINIAHPDTKIMIPKGNACVIPMDELPKGPRPYLDVEKKLNDEDTYVPISISKTGKVSVIKGAVAKVSGMVKITPKGSTEAHKANINDILGEGDRIETGENGYIEIRLDNNNCLNLKPNTRLTIVKLVINPETGEFENIFEVTMGKIKARIENLKGNSKFEVKTPQAVCGARGTIMFVDVSQNSTRSFFEGGNGYMTNTITGNSRDIPPGTSSTSDSYGNVSNPTQVSDSDRQSYGEGWNPAAGTEGYSSPEGGAGAGIFDSDTGSNMTGAAAGTNTSDLVGGAAGSTPSVDVPFTETNPSTSSTNTDTTYVFPCFDTTDNSVTINNLTSLWGGPETPATVSGRYSNPNNYTLWKNNFEKTTSDGARIVGSSGGRIVNNLLEGLLVAIYIRPDSGSPTGYTAGYIKLAPSEGTLNGMFYPATGTFLAPNQNVTAYHNDPTNILPEQLYWGSEYLNEDPITGNMGGNLIGSMSGSSLNLKESGVYQYLWGIWKITAHGTYSAPLDSSWNAVMGGLDEYSDGDISYWLVNIDGTEFADGNLRGNITGKSLSYNSAGFLHHMTLDDISGEMIGTYSGGTWQALGAGTVDEKPLAFSGETTHENGVVYALFGGTSSLWSGSPQATFIGDFNSQQVPSHDIWRFHVLGKTDDNGAIYGMAGGTNVNNTFKGLLYALYIRPDPDNPGQYLAGYLKSTNIAGDIYPDIDMFSAQANLTAVQMGPTGASVDQLLSYMQNDVLDDSSGHIYRDEFDGNVSGDIKGTLSGEIISICYNYIDQMWSIWRAESGGIYSSEPQGAWNAVIGGSNFDVESGDTGYYICHINGSGWSSNEFSGNITGKEIWYSSTHFNTSTVGLMTGETIGTYADGTWKAVNAGVTEELSLAFGGDTCSTYTGESNGVFGGTGSLWSGSPSFTIINTYHMPDPTNKLWMSGLEGKTSNGAGFVGLAGGLNADNSFKGLLYALYVKSDGTTGYIKSTNLTGDVYLDIELFQADGNIKAYLPNITSYSPGTTGYLPSDLYWGNSAAIKMDDITPGLVNSATFSGNITGGTVLNIEDQNWWNIWRTNSSGTYTSPAGDNWQSVCGGFSRNELSHSTYWDGYYIGHMTGGAWSNGEFSGTLVGKALSYERSGVMHWDDLETMSGELVGAYGAGSWQAVNAGVTNAEPLQFGGMLEDNDGTTGNFAHYDADLDIVAWDGSSHITGLLGGTGSLWSASSQVTVIGEFANPEGRNLWGVDIKGNTKDDGAFLGIMGGTWLNNLLKGMSYAFYIRPDPANPGKYLTGYLKSTDISGSVYPGINMFETTTGTYSFNLDLPTLITPAELSSEIEKSGRIIGSINGGIFSGIIDGNSTNIDNEDWSLWKTSLGGTYISKPSAGWIANMGGWSIHKTSGKIDSYWLGTSSGVDAWQDGGFSGTVDVTNLSDENMEHALGKTLGAYNTGNKTWEALAIGVSTMQKSLTSSGRFVAQGWDVGAGSSFDFAGLIGLTDPIWGANPDFISMGEFTPPDISEPNKQFAWYVQKEWGTDDKKDGFVSRYYNYDTSNYTYTTYDDVSTPNNETGAFYGLSAGVGGGIDGSTKLKGKIYSLYVSPTGTTGVFDAGVIYGSIAGNYYPDVEMYRLDGNDLTKNPHASNIGISPANLHNSIDWGTLSVLDDNGGGGAGTIHANGGGGTMLNIAGQNWGVWNLAMGGTTYDGAISYPWDIYDLTGMTTPGATSADTNIAGGAWLSGIDGTKWSGNELEGNLKAIWIVLDKNGTLSGRTVSGPLTGYYAEDAGGVSGTWQAGAAGEWVEVNSNLLTGPGSLDDNIRALGPIHDVPITVACPSVIMSMTGVSGITSLNMDTHLYNMYNTGGHADGIWAAIINGTYSTPPTSNWSIAVENGSDHATLSGPAWSLDGHWVADHVSGTVGGNTLVDGQAAGTYDSGTFQGTGTGTFTQP